MKKKREREPHASNFLCEKESTLIPHFIKRYGPHVSMTNTGTSMSSLGNAYDLNGVKMKNFEILRKKRKNGTESPRISSCD